VLLLLVLLLMLLLLRCYWYTQPCWPTGGVACTSMPSTDFPAISFWA
jgi:hypothetical protein